jgi:hypothetical protein
MTAEPCCPRCHRPYPFGDPRSVVAPPVPCFDCEQARLARFIQPASGVQIVQPAPRRCTDSPACRDAGCADCERSYGPRPT